MEVIAPCPRCDEVFAWELSLAVPREIAWEPPFAPRFRFCCGACDAPVTVTFRWSLEAGAATRRLRIAGDRAGMAPEPRILLVDGCPHGCGQRLGLRIEPDDPWATSRLNPGEERVLGGYRCPRCDAEGRLRIATVLELGTTD